jgi:DNA helicase-2/ATP-dependent DNA helicase PcrA
VGGTDLIQGSSVVEHEHKSHFSEIAVIYRTHSIRRQIEKKLSLSGIPLQVIGVDSFWEEKEMQFIFSILKYLVEPTPRNYQSIVTSRAIPFSKKVSKLISIELSQTMDISNLAVRIKDICSGNPNDMHILSTINIQIDGLLGKYKTLSIEEVVHMALTLLSFTTEEKRRPFQDDIKQLFSLTYRFVSLKDFINYIGILRDNEYYDPDAERVTLMSIHASKGLEFDHVFIPAFENGAIPYVRETDDILEERNLFYVALTRARKNVFLISPQSRNGKSTTPSLFLKDIEKHILFKKDIQGDLYLKKKEKEKQKKSQLKLF